MSGVDSSALTEADCMEMKAHLKRMRLADLKDICRNLALTVSGKKEELFKRICGVIDQAKETSNDIALKAIRILILKTIQNDPLVPFSVLYNALRTGRADFLTLLSSANREITGPSVANNPNAPIHPPVRQLVPNYRTHPSNIRQINAIPNQLKDFQIYFLKSPFYTVKRLVPPSPQYAKGTVASRAELVLSFDPRANVVTKELNLRYFIFCGKVNPLVSVQAEAPLEYPVKMEFRLNNVLVKEAIASRGIKNEPGSAKPIDITPYVNFNAINKAQLTFVQSDAFLLYCYVVEKISVDQLMKLLKLPRQDFEASVRKIREDATKVEDDDIIVDSVNISLKDPLTYAKIKTPVKSTNCNHLQCFDFQAFLYLQEQQPTWKCPVCSGKVSLQTLTISEYFEDIVSKTPDDVEQVIINADGTWSLPNESTESYSNGNSYKRAKTEDLNWKFKDQNNEVSKTQVTSPAAHKKETQDSLGKSLINDSIEEIIILDSDEEAEEAQQEISGRLTLEPNSGQEVSSESSSSEQQPGSEQSENLVQQLEQQRLEQQRSEQQRLEQLKLEQQKLEQQMLEQQRLQQQRKLEQQRRLEQQQRLQQKQDLGQRQNYTRLPSVDQLPHTTNGIGSAFSNHGSPDSILMASISSSHSSLSNESLQSTTKESSVLQAPQYERSPSGMTNGSNQLTTQQLSIPNTIYDQRIKNVFKESAETGTGTHVQPPLLTPPQLPPIKASQLVPLSTRAEQARTVDTHPQHQEGSQASTTPSTLNPPVRLPGIDQVHSHHSNRASSLFDRDTPPDFRGLQVHDKCQPTTTDGCRPSISRPKMTYKSLSLPSYGQSLPLPHVHQYDQNMFQGYGTPHYSSVAELSAAYRREVQKRRSSRDQQIQIPSEHTHHNNLPNGSQPSHISRSAPERVVHYQPLIPGRHGYQPLGPDRSVNSDLLQMRAHGRVQDLVQIPHSREDQLGKPPVYRNPENQTSLPNNTTEHTNRTSQSRPGTAQKVEQPTREASSGVKLNHTHHGQPGTRISVRENFNGGTGPQLKEVHHRDKSDDSVVSGSQERPVDHTEWRLAPLLNDRPLLTDSVKQMNAQFPASLKQLTAWAPQGLARSPTAVSTQTETRSVIAGQPLQRANGVRRVSAHASNANGQDTRPAQSETYQLSATKVVDSDHTTTTGIPRTETEKPAESSSTVDEAQRGERPAFPRSSRLFNLRSALYPSLGEPEPGASASVALAPPVPAPAAAESVSVSQKRNREETSEERQKAPAPPSPQAKPRMPMGTKSLNNIDKPLPELPKHAYNYPAQSAEDGAASAHKRPKVVGLLGMVLSEDTINLSVSPISGRILNLSLDTPTSSLSGTNN